jgi:uncharacterized protein (DUF1800 family)
MRTNRGSGCGSLATAAIGKGAVNLRLEGCTRAHNKLTLLALPHPGGWRTAAQSLTRSLVAMGLCLLGSVSALAATGAAAACEDLRAISSEQWTRARASHLLERAGFGALAPEIDRFAALTPRQAVQALVRYQNVPDDLPAFEESGVFDPGLDPFAPSRPAATDAAKANGEALGVKVKPQGNRRLQQVADRFLYWLRATRLESQRIGYWWANRMLRTQRPLQEKMTLFWHGHFATSDEKVRDYRKMLAQNAMLRRLATGNFRDLLIAVAQDPAMLAYLDAGVNVKGAPNENFAREIMELFTMGVGHYSEQDIREAARAFTGWNFEGLRFVVDSKRHDDAPKTVLGQTGPFDGVQVIDLILAQPATAEFIAKKLYRYFVREEVSEAFGAQLGRVLREANYEIAPFLETILLSADFYCDASVGTRIKPPVELVVSTYRKLGLQEIPGIPDFNDLTDSMGQKLLFPPNVAGWAGGRSWITPGLLMIRGNFIYDTVFAPIDFVPHDRIPDDVYGIVPVAEKLARGVDITTATRPEGKELTSMSMQNDRDEDFNTRLASYHAWRKAIERIKPIARTPARLDLSAMVREAGARTAADAVDRLIERFMSVPVDGATRKRLAVLLTEELGTEDLLRADSYMEEGLRNLLHVILSLPGYQLG